MPPLLPEYLSQPVQMAINSLPKPTQVVVQSVPTDWWSIGSTFTGTLLGAGLGAGLGALMAYRSTVKANLSLLRRQKLEEALITILDIEDALQIVFASVPFPIDKELSPDNRKRTSDALQEIRLVELFKVKAIFEVYDDDLNEITSSIITSINRLKLIVYSLYVINFTETSAMAYKIRRASEDDLELLKNRLIEKLRV